MECLGRHSRAVRVLLGLFYMAGPIRVCLGLKFLYKGKHTRSFTSSFWRAKEAIRIFFLLLLEDFISEVFCCIKNNEEEE